MTKAAFTQGTWMASGPTGQTMQGYSQPWAVVVQEKATLVCGCFGDTSGGIEAAEANAKLIAAAPELLAALETAYETLGANNHHWVGRNTSLGQELLSAMCYAISQATGRDAQDVQDDYCNRYLLTRNVRGE